MAEVLGGHFSRSTAGIGGVGVVERGRAGEVGVSIAVSSLALGVLHEVGREVSL